MAMKMIEVSGALKTSLTNRIAAAKSPGSNLAWTTSRMVWLRFTSNVLQNGKLSDFQSLESNNTTDDLYDTTTRLTPMPGLVSADIKHTGTLKTLKKIEVSYKCYSLKHLEELEKLFMSLGKTVVLEYGWTVKPSGGRMVDIMTAADHALTFDEFLTKAAKLSDINEGCYGAEKGVVSNFSWTQDSNGTYSCTTTFSSPAEMMMSHESTKVGKDAVCCKTEEQEDGSNCAKESDLSRKLNQLLASDSVIPMGKSRSKYGKPWGFAMKMDKQQSDAEKADNSTWESFKSFIGGGSIMTAQKFVTYAWFEEELLNDALLPKAPGAKTSNNGGTTADQAPASYRNTAVKSAYRFDSRMTTLANPDKMTSADPTVCMLPGQNFWDLVHEKKSANAAGDVLDFEQMLGLNQMKPFKVSRTGDAYKNLGWLAHICINVRFLQRMALESETIEELVNKVLDGINQACGNPWQLIITPLPDNPALMTVVDAKSLGKSVTPYALSVYGNHSIMKDVTIDTKVSNDIKAQIMYGSNSKVPEKDGGSAEPNNDEFSLFGAGLKDRTPGWGEMVPEVQNHCETDEDGTTHGTPKTDDPDVELEHLKEQYTDAWLDLVKGVDPDTIDTMKASVKALQAFSPYKDVVQNSPPILPINLSFKMDGIGGFKWGHSLTIDPIPARYDGSTFMVTGIDHSISGDSWDTSLSTVLRIKPLPPAEKVERKKPKPIAKATSWSGVPVGQKA